MQLGDFISSSRKTFQAGFIHLANMNSFWHELEMEYGAPCDRENPHKLKWKDPEALGRRAQPSPATLESSFRVYEAAGRAQMAKFGCVFIFVQPQIPAKN